LIASLELEETPIAKCPTPLGSYCLASEFCHEFCSGILSTLLPQDPETTLSFEKEVQPHESGLRAYLHGISTNSVPLL